MAKETIKIKIIGFSRPHLWYADKLGQSFTAFQKADGHYQIRDAGSGFNFRFVLKDDAEVAQREKVSEIASNEQQQRLFEVSDTDIRETLAKINEKLSLMRNKNIRGELSMNELAHAAGCKLTLEIALTYLYGEK